MKTIITYIALATCIFAANSYAMQGLQRGDLIVHNTLNEPIAYHVSTILNGTDPSMGLTITNSSASSIGVIPANANHRISNSGININGFLWGRVINLALKRQGAPQAQQFNLERLGTYILTLDQNGKLDLSR